MTNLLTYQTKTAKEMRAVGAELAQKVLNLGAKPILLLLDGTLGAGKTTFSQGFFRALGVEEEVTSPSYGILHEYGSTNSRPLYHMDMYRISSVDDFEELEVEEILSSCEPFVFVIEWASKFPEIWENLKNIQILRLKLAIESDESHSLEVEGL